MEDVGCEVVVEGSVLGFVVDREDLQDLTAQVRKFTVRIFMLERF